MCYVFFFQMFNTLPGSFKYFFTLSQVHFPSQSILNQVAI